MRLLTAILALSATQAIAEPRLIGTLDLTFDGAAEMSAIEVADNGTDVSIITDRGVFIRGTVRRDNSVPVGFEVVAQNRLKDNHGNTIERAVWADSEGLAIAPDGRIFISFEGVARVWAYDRPDASAQRIARAAEFDGFQSNSGLEALAIGPDGALYAIPERSGQFNAPFPVFRYTDKWDIPFTIPRSGSFLVTGADFGPDGKLYLLERDFLGIGFRTRVRRFDRDGSKAETLLTTSLGVHGNLEGISVWRDDTGHIRLTMVSDNGQTFSPSTIVEYQLDD